VSDLQDIGRQVQAVARDINQWAAELESRGAGLRRAAAQASASTRESPGAGAIAAALDDAARKCQLAASTLIAAKSAAEQFVARNVGGVGSATSADTQAVLDLTGLGHQEVNAALWSGSVEDVERIAARAVAFRRALQNFDVHKDTVFRGMDLSDRQLAIYEPGEVVRHPGFTHTSRDSDRELGGNTIFVIESKSGRSVGDSSAVPWEKEVTFDMSTRFYVAGKEWVDDLDRGPAKLERGRWLIYLLER
jgi:hypothetical protein